MQDYDFMLAFANAKKLKNTNFHDIIFLTNKNNA